MQLHSNGYTFKPHEMPMMIGSPASPDHPKKRRIAYFLVGVLVSLAAGLQNSLMMAAQTQLQGGLGLDLQQGGWVQVAYYMTYACMSILLFKVRQHFGVNRFVNWLMLMTLAGGALQWFADSWAMELAARGVAGVVASGLMVTGLFYFMQAFGGTKKLAGAMLALGLMLSAMPLGQVLVPLVFADGDLQAVFWLSPAIALLTVGAMYRLPLPPGHRSDALSWLDVLSFLLFAGGVALLCAFLVQGRIVWWSTSWLGYLLAGGIGLTGTALLIESRRKEPMLDLSWMAMPQILVFGFTAALVRLLTSEQTVGAAGLMAALGMSGRQMIGFYTVVFVASVAGVLASMIRLDIGDIRRPVVVALLGLAVGAYLDTRVGLETRPHELYFSQALIAFSAMYFLGPMMLEGIIRALAKSPLHLMSFSAVFGLSQSLGGLAGAALFSAFVTVRARSHLADITAHFSPADPAVAAQIGQTAKNFAPLSTDQAVWQAQGMSGLMAQAAKQATVLAYNELFMLIAVLSFGAFLFKAAVWLRRRRRNIDILAEEKRRLLPNGQA